MARIETVSESNGPDRFNQSPICSQHQAGVRTGISDYCCCCNPCLYVRKNDSPTEPVNRLCCRCIPKLILAEYEPDNASPCCRSVVVPMFAKFEIINDHSVVAYSGSILGYDIHVYLSNGSITGYADEYGNTCQWTISVPYLGIYEEIAIDHKTVTCLGVPAVSLINVPHFGFCSGTISLANFAPVKVPFHVRYSVPPEETESLTVPFPYGFDCSRGDALPRTICVTKKRNQVGMIRAPHLPWEIDWWREFIWDEYFAPYFDYPQQEWIIGLWIYRPNDPTAFAQSMYLIQDLYGECWLQPDFNSPEGTDGAGEDYQRVVLSSCGCSLKILNVRPVNDPFPPTIPNDPLPLDLLGIDYRGGRCSCWDYHCGRRRCVPQYFCGYLFVNNTLYRNILFAWDATLKCWVSTSGVDLSGYPMPFVLQVCMEQSPSGKCQLVLSYEDYIIDPVEIDDTDVLLSGVFEGINYAGDGFLSLNITVSLDGTCNLLLSCGTATPCAAECGSHPEILFLTLHGYSLYTDYPPPPATGSCTANIAMIYHQALVVATGGGIVIGCGYVGWIVVNSSYFDLVTSTLTRADFLIKAELSLGGLTITRRLLSNPTLIRETHSATLTESCDPYYGYKLTDASLQNCFFGDEAVVFHHWYAEVTE